MKLLVYLTLMTVLLTLAACPKGEGEEAAQTIPATDNEPAIPTDEDKVAGEDFIAEAPVKSLAQSPLNLKGVSLGVSPDLHSSRYQELEVELEQEWREEGWTGIQTRRFDDQDGESEETSYYNEGRLVGFARTAGQDETEFEERIDLMGIKYGDPWIELPDFVVDTTAYEDFMEGDPDDAVFWVDPPTRTVIAGRYDADISSATWMLFHPQQLVSVRGDVMAAMGS